MPVFSCSLADCGHHHQGAAPNEPSRYSARIGMPEDADQG